MLKLCEDAGLELSGEERQQLDDWLMHGWAGAAQPSDFVRGNDEPLELPTPLTAENVEAPESLTTPLD